jgi:hypothetical protein
MRIHYIIKACDKPKELDNWLEETISELKQKAEIIKRDGLKQLTVFAIIHEERDNSYEQAENNDKGQ